LCRETPKILRNLVKIKTPRISIAKMEIFSKVPS